jgi:hypothetical protein
MVMLSSFLSEILFYGRLSKYKCAELGSLHCAADWNSQPTNSSPYPSIIFLSSQSKTLIFAKHHAQRIPIIWYQGEVLTWTCIINLKSSSSWTECSLLQIPAVWYLRSSRGTCLHWKVQQSWLQWTQIDNRIRRSTQWTDVDNGIRRGT